MNKLYWKGDDITTAILDKSNDVLIFGSNPEGRHGAGLAKIAVNSYGAKYGKGRGLYGNSYALVTKNLRKGFIEVLADGTELQYKRVGCGSLRVSWLSDNLKEMVEVIRENPDRKFFFPYIRNAKNLNGIASSRIITTLTKIGVPSNLILHESFR